MKYLLTTLCMLLGVALAPTANAAETIVTIGTGSVTGVYYPTGGAICRMVNRGRKEHSIRCFAESTGGSVANLHALHDGELSMAIVQSDWQYNAYRGEGAFASDGPFRSLRSVFSLHSEMFTVAVTKDSGIKDFSGLKDKRVNIGDAGSGLRDIMMSLMEVHGWNKSSFAEISELKPSDAAAAFCSGKLDAMVFAAGHPNGLIQEITTNCGAKLIPVNGKEVQQLIAKNPYYTAGMIPGGMYQGNGQDTQTFGVKATLVTTADMDEETIYQLTKAVFDNFDAFKTLHFVFATLDKEQMANSGSGAPIHPGALRYFREAGLVKTSSKAEATEPTPVADVPEAAPVPATAEVKPAVEAVEAAPATTTAEVAAPPAPAAPAVVAEPVPAQAPARVLRSLPGIDPLDGEPDVRRRIGTRF